jgi:hypothetical protein
MSYKDLAKQREYQSRWISERRQRWVAENGPCSCGAWSDLEVHHKDPTKKVAHRIWSWNLERRMEELKKCCVLCHACHKKLSTEYRRQHLLHGSRGMYALGCRCLKCKAANAVSSRQWRATGCYPPRAQVLG